MCISYIGTYARGAYKKVTTDGFLVFPSNEKRRKSYFNWIWVFEYLIQKLSIIIATNVAQPSMARRGRAGHGTSQQQTEIAHFIQFSIRIIVESSALNTVTWWNPPRNGEEKVENSCVYGYFVKCKIGWASCKLCVYAFCEIEFIMLTKPKHFYSILILLRECVCVHFSGRKKEIVHKNIAKLENGGKKSTRRCITLRMMCTILNCSGTTDCRYIVCFTQPKPQKKTKKEMKNIKTTDKRTK